MKIKLTILFLLLLISSCYKDLNCSDFKEGTFAMRTDNRNFTIVRKGNTQIESNKGIKSSINAESIPLIINWIDDCTYSLKFDEGKIELKKHQKFLNENGGIIVNVIRINGKCMDYRSTMITKEGKIVAQKGAICKEL